MDISIICIYRTDDARVSSSKTVYEKKRCPRPIPIYRQKLRKLCVHGDIINLCNVYTNDSIGSDISTLKHTHLAYISIYRILDLREQSIITPRRHKMLRSEKGNRN